MEGEGEIGNLPMNGNIFNSQGVHVATVVGSSIYGLRGQKLYDLKGTNIYRLPTLDLLKIPAGATHPRSLAGSARSCEWRAVWCHFWPSNLSANQQRNEQRCSQQATANHREKTNVGIVVSHCPLLRDNSRYLKRFPPSLGAGALEPSGNLPVLRPL